MENCVIDGSTIIFGWITNIPQIARYYAAICSKQAILNVYFTSFYTHNQFTFEEHLSHYY
jgi:hypothetical protein